MSKNRNEYIVCFQIQNGHAHSKNESGGDASETVK